MYILNKQLPIADKGRSSCLRAERRAETPRRKNVIFSLKGPRI
jgi:hypothetical protein